MSKACPEYSVQKRRKDCCHFGCEFTGDRGNWQDVSTCPVTPPSMPLCPPHAEEPRRSRRSLRTLGCDAGVSKHEAARLLRQGPPSFLRDASLRDAPQDEVGERRCAACERRRQRSYAARTVARNLSASRR